MLLLLLEDEFSILTFIWYASLLPVVIYFAFLYGSPAVATLLFSMMAPVPLFVPRVDDCGRLPIIFFCYAAVIMPLPFD